MWTLTRTLVEERKQAVARMARSTTLSTCVERDGSSHRGAAAASLTEPWAQSFFAELERITAERNGGGT